MKYHFNEIEAKWQKYWLENETFKAQNESSKPKFYVLDMFPYPSGAGLHVGHPLGYIASDIYARYKRHKGFNVLHPQGYDSFGLPAEQYAIQTGQHPAKTTENNIKTYRRQLDQIGFSYDWSREVRTSDPDYYRWTQWIFIQLFESYYCNDADQARPISASCWMFSKRKGITESMRHATKTSQISVLHNGTVGQPSSKKRIWPNTGLRIFRKRRSIGARNSARFWPMMKSSMESPKEEGFPVVRKKMKQWSMRITAYAQRLLDGLEKIDWPQSLKDSQKNWIGRSEGAMVRFQNQGLSGRISGFYHPSRHDFWGLLYDAGTRARVG
jgi:leucyl-tRNA synthetase